MDELIVLLIKGIIRLMTGPPPQKGPGMGQPAIPPQFRPPAPTIAQQQRRQVRRPPQRAMVAVASPIITPTGDDLELPPPTVRPTAKRGVPTPKVPQAVEPTVNVRRLLTPASLRQQVVLSEILRPPLAMRDDR